MSFAEELNKEFNGRFRIRWSEKRQVWQLEQKVRPGLELEPPVNESGEYDTYDDAYIRARDGYWLIQTITAGDRMPCPICNNTLHVPHMRTAEVQCRRCQLMGKDGRYMAGYYPLNHTLIEHLKDIDPERDGLKRTRQRVHARNAELRQRRDKEVLDKADGRVLDDHRQWNAAMVGYGNVKSKDGFRTPTE